MSKKYNKTEERLLRQLLPSFPKTRKCLECSAQFLANHIRDIYCSDKCLRTTGNCENYEYGRRFNERQKEKK